MNNTMESQAQDKEIFDMDIYRVNEWAAIPEGKKDIEINDRTGCTEYYLMDKFGKWIEIQVKPND